MSRNLLLSGVAAVALGTMSLAPVARADLLTVEWATSVSGTNSTTSSSTTGTVTWSRTVTESSATFTTQGAAADALAGPLSPPKIFQSQSTDALSATGHGTLVLMVTESGVTSPGAPSNWLSGFTANFDSTGWTDAMSVWVDQTNKSSYTNFTQLQGIGTEIGSATFNGDGSSLQTSTSNFHISTLAIPYSITEVFDITVSQSGSLNDTIALNASVIPEPASLSLLGGGLLAFGAWRRRQSKKA